MLTIDKNPPQAVLDVIKENWSSFCEEGASRQIFDLGFFLDTGNSQPVCCRHPIYGIYEKKITNKHI